MDVHPHLSRNPWFSAQSAALQDAIVTHGRTVRLSPGQTAYLQGDDNTGLWLVLSGSIRLEMPVGADRDVLIAIAAADTMFGRTRAGGANARIVSARAVGPTLALILSDRAIDRIGTDDPAMWRALITALHAQVDALLASVAALLLPPRARLAARMVQMAADGSVGARQSDLADLCGLTRKSVNGHLRQWQADGIVRLCYGAVQITDGPALNRIAQDMA